MTSGKKDISVDLKTRLFGILLVAEKRNKLELQFTEDCRRKFEESPSVKYTRGTYFVLGSSNLSRLTVTLNRSFPLQICSSLCCNMSG